MSFSEKVITVIAKIRRGEVLSYQQVAALAGSPLAYRAVGNILKKNYRPEIPCHRVVRSDGNIGGYNRGVAKKERLLKQEGVLVGALAEKGRKYP